MQSRFPYGIKYSPGFGKIFTVHVWLDLESPTGIKPFMFLFDTGADITSFPISATGYEGTTVLVYRSNIKIRFNRKVEGLRDPSSLRSSG